MMPVDSWHDPHGSVQVEDHYDLAQVLHNAEAECMVIVGHPVIRKLSRRFHRTLLKSAISCQKVIEGNRRSLRSLVICNYEPSRHPLYTAVASQMPLLDLFGLGRG
jgi:hypothetical protein